MKPSNTTWAIFLAVFCVIVFCFDAPLSTPPRAGIQLPQVEIQIRNSTFEFHGGVISPNIPVTILIKNLDPIRHGFTSELLESLPIRVETKSAITYGKGVIGIHINPKQQVQIHLTPTREGSFSFQCDLHPSMKGELLMLSIEAL